MVCGRRAPVRSRCHPPDHDLEGARHGILRAQTVHSKLSEWRQNVQLQRMAKPVPCDPQLCTSRTAIHAGSVQVSLCDYFFSSMKGSQTTKNYKDNKRPKPNKPTKKAQRWRLLDVHARVKQIFSTSADAMWAVCSGHRRRIGNTAY